MLSLLDVGSVNGRALAPHHEIKKLTFTRKEIEIILGSKIIFTSVPFQNRLSGPTHPKQVRRHRARAAVPALTNAHGGGGFIARSLVLAQHTAQFPTDGRRVHFCNLCS